ncbi:MAG TPA: glycosyltransferase, partial [Blastocatellia bacterium]|nr:glycosyltransferase [Blastocatellia bacterium]
MNKNLTSLYICYWSLKDPLCQTQCLSYLRGLASGGHRFALMTFEQRRFRMNASEAREQRASLAQEGILWYPLRYHKRLPLVATAFDLFCGAITGIYITLRHRTRIVHSRSSIAGAIGLLVSVICRVKFLYDADSRLSEEYADNGYWSRDSLQFRLLAWFEAACRNRAHAVVVLAETLKNDFVKQFGVTSPIEVIPCCVDLERFERGKGHTTVSRAAKRAELGLKDCDPLLVYVGKSGPRYLLRETFEFLKAFRRTTARARLLILSADQPEIFYETAQAAGVDPACYNVRHAKPREVVEWLACADAGVALIRPAECERGSSPIKIGEYLAAGLPVVITAGIGDYSKLVSSERVGVVISTLDVSGYLRGATNLVEL